MKRIAAIVGIGINLKHSKAMDEAGLSPAEKKEHVDRIAAVLILQSYLDRQKNG